MSMVCALLHKIRMILNSFIAKILLLDKIFCNIIKEFGKDNLIIRKCLFMPKNRIEAFRDGVLAIIITIMVLELHTPKDFTFEAIKEVIPTFLPIF